jgi:hypothetical protein
VIEYCLHLANLFYLGSFLARDMLWLRLLTCGGLLLGVVFFSCQAAPMYGPAAWHVLFLLINVAQICRLVRERRRMIVTIEQHAVAQAAFNDLSRDEMLTLLTRAMCSPTKCLPNLRRAARLPLSEDERVVRDLALRGLCRTEIVYLLAQRLSRYVRWMNPVRWRVRRQSQVGEPIRVAAR